jgi:hypothetical protein
MAGKGRTSIFTNILKNVEKRKKAVAKAGGGKPGKRIKASPTIVPKSKGRKRK